MKRNVIIFESQFFTEKLKKDLNIYFVKNKLHHYKKNEWKIKMTTYKFIEIVATSDKNWADAVSR